MKTVRSILGRGQKKRVAIADDEYELAAELIAKYRLEPGKEMTDDEFEELLEENDRLRYDRLAIRRLQTMQTEHELAEYLTKKGAPQQLIRKLISSYKKKKYLDDEAYASYYVETRKHSEGPRLIEDRLKKKGVSPAIIAKLVDYDAFELVYEPIKKRVETNRTKNRRQLRSSLKTHFVNKGFPLETVDEALKRALTYYSADEKALLKKDYEKLLSTYEKRMDRAALEPFIKRKLYQKGYDYEDIKELF
ncbi:MAG: RecX family transcriptional regulator [Acholeplasmataceae bacterium]